MTKPLVSIIVPTYKSNAYFGQCIDSAVNQTYENIEILLIDDGNDDPHFERYLSAEKIRVIKHDSNYGLSVARNTGIQNAKGKYCLFLDDDDYLDKELVEQLVTKMEKQQPDVIFFNAWCIQEAEEEKPERIFSDDCVSDDTMSGKEFFYRMTEKKYFRGAAWAQFWKVSTLQSKALYFEPGIYHEDALFTFQALLSGVKVLGTDCIGYHYRIRQNSIMTSVSTVHRKRDLVKIIEKAIAIWEALEETSVEGEQAFLTYLDTLVVMVDPEYTNIEESNRIESELGSLHQKILYRLISGHSGRFFDLSQAIEHYVDADLKIYVWGTNRKSAEIIQNLGDRVQIAGIIKEHKDVPCFYGHPVLSVLDTADIIDPFCVLISHLDVEEKLVRLLESNNINYRFL